MLTTKRASFLGFASYNRKTLLLNTRIMSEKARKFKFETVGQRVCRLLASGLQEHGIPEAFVEAYFELVGIDCFHSAALPNQRLIDSWVDSEGFLQRIIYEWQYLQPSVDTSSFGSTTNNE